MGRTIVSVLLQVVPNFCLMLVLCVYLETKRSQVFKRIAVQQDVMGNYSAQSNFLVCTAAAGYFFNEL